MTISIKILFLLTNFLLNTDDNYEIVYSINMDRSVIREKVDMDRDMRDRIMSMERSYSDLSYTLLTNNNIGIYTLNKGVSNDSEGYALAVSQTGGNSKYIYARNAPDYRIAQVNDKIFHIASRYEHSQWQIKDEFKTILGYECQKATNEYTFFSHLRNRNVDILTTIWFTPNIDVPFGPKGIVGAPGLILEATTTG